jgi:hypothetical protein
VKSDLPPEQAMEPLKLSDDLVNDVQLAVIKHDERAKDGGVAIQYYAAIIGYVLAQQDYAMEQKEEFLDQLNTFSHHVFTDCAKQSAPATPDAMGKWRPGDP